MMLDEQIGRMAGCESTNHDQCYGELWQCAACRKTVCYAEGTDDHREVCDDCWVRHQESLVADIPQEDIPAWLNVLSDERDSYDGESHDTPNLDTLMQWMDEGIAEATDGCPCEPDGRCEHGYQSWLLELGLI